MFRRSSANRQPRIKLGTRQLTKGRPYWNDGRMRSKLQRLIGRVVLLEWADACTYDEWTEDGDGTELTMVKTVGILIRVTKDAAVLAMGKCEADMLHTTMAIALPNIRKVHSWMEV